MTILLTDYARRRSIGAQAALLFVAATTLLIDVRGPCTAAPPRSTAKPEASAAVQNDLHKLGLMMTEYLSDNDGQFPAMSTPAELKKALLPYATSADAQCFIDPENDQPYLPDAYLTGKQLRHWIGFGKGAGTPNSIGRIIIVYTEAHAADGGRYVCFANDRTAYVSDSTFHALISATDQNVDAVPHTSSLEKESPNVWEMAIDAINSGDNKNATKYALQLLRGNTDPNAWYYGNIIDNANQILGIAALREGRVKEADDYLIAAGKTPGSPQLDSFGPHMILAQKLLDKGQKAAVIQYLDLVARFWAHTSPAELKRLDERHPGLGADVAKMNVQNQQQIDQWKKQIRAGLKPQLHMSNAGFP